MVKQNTLTGPELNFSNNPNKLIFLLHGYGDNGENFISLADQINESLKEFNFYAPNAPSFITQYSSGRQWFDLYPNGIYFVEAGLKEKEILKNDCINSLKMIENYIHEKCSLYNLTYKDCFILGFSQGAMMAFELGKMINDIFAGNILLSGRILPTENKVKKLFSRTPVLVVHGDQDTILDPKYYEESCHILKKEGFYFESHLLEGVGHTISLHMIQLIQNFIKKNI